MAAPPPPPEGEEGQDGVEVCLFDESPERFSRAVRAISELAGGEPEPGFPDAEVERLASSIMFLREWSLFSYEPTGVVPLIMWQMALLCASSLLRDSGKRNPGGTMYLISFVVHYQRRKQSLRLVSCCKTLLYQKFLWWQKKEPKSCQDVDQVHNIEKERLPLTDSGYNCTVNPELIAGQQDGPDEGQETGAIVLAGPTMQQNAAIYNSSDGKSPLPKL